MPSTMTIQALAIRSVALAAAMLVFAALPARAQPAAPTNRTYDAVIEGMTCRQLASGRLDCLYDVGESLRFTIAGVGQEDAVISFARVDSTRGYVAGFSVLHGCVVVKPSAAGDSSAALAFISPRDGRVYRIWQQCKQPARR
jgi:hypothetical protein